MSKLKPHSVADQRQEQHLTKLTMHSTAAMHLIDTRIGAVLKQARHSAGLEQRELAKRCSVSEMDVVRYEDGASRPSAKTLLAISQVLGASIVEIFRAAA